MRDALPSDVRVLARFSAQRDDLKDIADEYVITDVRSDLPGVMLWGRAGDRWFANPSAREVLRQLLAERSSLREKVEALRPDRVIHSSAYYTGFSEAVEYVLALLDEPGK